MRLKEIEKKRVVLKTGADKQEEERSRTFGHCTVWFCLFQPDCRLQLQSQALSEPAWLYTLLLITPTHNRSAVQHSAQNIDVCGACGGDHAKQIALGGISQAQCGMDPAVKLVFIGMANMWVCKWKWNLLLLWEIACEKGIHLCYW